MPHRTLSPYHDRTLNVATLADIYNVAGSLNTNAFIRAGDRCYVTADNVMVTYVDPTVGSATYTIDAVLDRAVEIVVGNALNGATLRGCDYLDPGDGTGILAAMAFAAANPTKKYKVYVGPGTYTLLAATPLITIPTNVVEVFGASSGGTTIVGVAASGVSPQIVGTSGALYAHDLAFVSPTNVAGQLTSSNGLILASNDQRWERCSLTINCSASVVHASASGFRYTPTGTAVSNLVFESCSVSFVGDTATFVTFGAGFRCQTTAQTTVPTAPLSYRNCTVTCDGGGAIRGFYCDQTVDFYNLRAIRCLQGLVGSGVATLTQRGPRGVGLVFDARGRLQSTTALAVALNGNGAAGSAYGTNLRGILLLGDANVDASSRAVSIVNAAAYAWTDIGIEAQSVCTVAGSGGITLTVRDGSMAGLDVNGIFGTGDVVSSATSGVMSDGVFRISSCRNFTVPANAVRTRLDSCRISGTCTITAAAVNTVGVGNIIGTLTDGGTSSLFNAAANVTGV